MWISNKNVGEPVHCLNIYVSTHTFTRQAAANPLRQIILLKYKLREYAFEKKCATRQCQYIELFEQFLSRKIKSSF